MLGLVLLIIAWGPPDPDGPSGPRLGRPASCRSAASPAHISIPATDDRGRESAPPAGSPLAVGEDEIEGDDPETLGAPLSPASDLSVPFSIDRFHHPSAIVIPPPPEARSPRLRC